MRIEVLHAVSVRLGMGQIDFFTVYDAPLGWGAKTAKIIVNGMGFWGTWNRCNVTTKRRISNICHLLK